MKIEGIQSPGHWLLKLPLRILVAPLMFAVTIIFGTVTVGECCLPQVNKNPIIWFVTWPLRILFSPLILLMVIFADMDF